MPYEALNSVDGMVWYGRLIVFFPLPWPLIFSVQFIFPTGRQQRTFSSTTFSSVQHDSTLHRRTKRERERDKRRTIVECGVAVNCHAHTLYL